MTYDEKQGKPVFTIPANVGSQGAEGTNLLLRDGARLVLSVNDLLEPYILLTTETVE